MPRKPTIFPTILLIPIFLAATVTVTAEEPPRGFSAISTQKLNHGETLLHKAINNGSSIDVIKYLIDNGIKPSTADNYGETPLHLAIYRGYSHNYKISPFSHQKILLEHGADVHAKAGRDRRTPLHHAASHNPDLDTLKILIEFGSDIHAKDSEGRTPLHMAAMQNPNPEIIQYLIAQGADVNAAADLGMKPIHYAVGNRNDEILKILVEHGADAHAVVVSEHYSFKGKTVLHYAAGRNSGVDHLKFLLDLGLDVNAKDAYNKMPIHIAASHSFRVDVMELLVEHGADVNAKSQGNLTPLHFVAANHKKSDVVEFLIEQGADVNAVTSNGKRPLDIAKEENVKETLRLAGAREGSRFDDIFAAAEKGSAGDIKIFLEADVNIQATDHNGLTPLHIAAAKNPDIKVLKFLIKQGADVNARFNDHGRLGKTPQEVADTEEKKTILRAAGAKPGNQPAAVTRPPAPVPARKPAAEPDPGPPYKDIFTAVRKGTVADVQFHINQGVDIHAEDKFGTTALSRAVMSNADLDVIKFLLENGADPDLKDKDGKTPFHQTAYSVVRLDILKTLLEYGADINARDKDGETPLSYFAKWPHAKSSVNNHLGRLKFLLENGANVDVKDKRDNTPLHRMASEDVPFEALEVMILWNADANAKNQFGDTPLTYARTNEAKTLLSDAAARQKKMENIYDAVREGTGDDVHYILKNRNIKLDVKYAGGATLLHLAAAHNPDAEILKILLGRGADIRAADADGKTPLDHADTEEKQKILRDAGGKSGRQ